MEGSPLNREAVVEALEQLAQYGVAAPGTAQVFDVGTRDFVRYFEKEICDDLVARGGATCKIVEGPYGSGKTHLLQLLEDSALARGMAVVRTDLSNALSLEDWHLVAQHVLQNIELATPRGVVRSLPRILDSLGRDDRSDLARLKHAHLPHTGMARAMALGCMPAATASEAKTLLYRFLLGEKVSVAALAASGVSGVKQPLSRRNAELVLKTVLAGLHALGVPGTMLLFDETEKSFVVKKHYPTKKIVAGANLLRRLIDGAANGSLVGSAIVFAVLPDFVNNCALAYPALGQRLSRQPAARRAGWRWPVLPLEAITSEPDPRRFVFALVERHEEVLRQVGIVLNGNKQALLEAGMQTLAGHAGSDYRRFVVKRVASLSLAHIER